MDNRALIAMMQRRRRRSHRRNGNGVTTLFLRLALLGAFLSLLLVVLAVGTVAAAAYGVYAYFTQDLPAPEAVGIQTTQESFKTTRIYDRTGQTVLYEIYDPYGGNRTLVPISQIPDHLKYATIALEDKNFYENPGFDVRGLARAFVSNLQGERIQGGSSITQQLIKNVIIPPRERMEISYQRKFKELILAWELSRRHPGRQGKDQILEWYLNTINYGNLAYGVEAAANTYFGKHAYELNLAEAAMLAPIPQYPAINPLNPAMREEAIKRRNIVLDQMYLQGYITADEAYRAKLEPYVEPAQYQDRRSRPIAAPHFSIYVRQLLEKKFGPELLYRGGLKVYTTLDLRLQKLAEDIAREQVARLTEQKKDVTNAALVAIDPRTGEILAMLGSVDYYNPAIDGQVNVTLAQRQPGSSFKPFTYATAFMQGYTPATMIMDVRTSFLDDPNPPYAPENYDRKYHGPVLLRTALASSFNIPAVKLLNLVGVRNVINTAHKMGINTLNRDIYGLALTLGGGEVTLLDMTYANGDFANGGLMAGQPVPAERRRPGFRELDPVAILRVEDGSGNVLEEYSHPETREVIPPQVAYLVTNILSDNNARTPGFGANSVLKLSRPAAVKTGTTNDWRDNWTLGYTPQLVVGVWVGNADNHEMQHISGVDGAGPIWHYFMEEALKGQPVLEFMAPPDLVQKTVSAVSGLLPTELVTRTVSEIFIKGTEPTAYDNVLQKVRICKSSGKLATVYCPPDQVEERVYAIFPADAADWVRENNIPQPPREYDDTFGPPIGSGDVAILSPEPYSYITGTVQIVGNARGDGFQFYRVQFGEGLDPAAWTQVGGDHHNAVERGTLEYWDVSGLKDGLYTLQLLVGRGGNVHTESIQVTVDSTPPKMTLVYPWQDNVYTLGDDEWVSLQAEATDNVSMDRVEFFVDDQMVGISTVAPYNYKWTLKPDSVGTHTIRATAYDAAGNRVDSAKVKIKVEPKKEAEERK
jgi:penicillin-binding protein 1C